MSEKILYDVVNPSDPVTFEAKSFEAALGAILLVSNGNYAARPVRPDDAEEVPMFLLGMGVEEYFEKRGETIEGFVESHYDDIIDALKSFATVEPRERNHYDARLGRISDPDKRKAFIRNWDDKHRSSMNRITLRAHDLARQLDLRAKAEAA